MNRVPTAEDFERLLEALARPTALVELAVFGTCLLAAWVLGLLLRGARRPTASVWFGARIVDGLLFPLLALALALLARALLFADLPPAVFRLVVPILLSLAVIRLVVHVLHRAFPNSPPMQSVGRSVAWLAWIAAVLWITGVLPYVLGELDEIRWKIGNTRISARNVLDGVVSSVVVLVLALWLSSAFEARLLRGATDNLSIRRMAATLVRTLLLFLGLMFSLSAAGIDLTTLGVLGGAVGVGVGFGLQRLASNYVSGFVILAERSMRIGDIVKVDSFEGRITDITTRYTMIRALNGRESIVPNEMMVTQRVENYSLADPNVAVTTTVQVAYGTDLDAVLPRLVAAAAAVPRVIAAPAPSAQLSEFAADGLNLTVGFWIADPVNGTGNVRSDVNLAILRTLDAMGVEIPFPQRVLRRSGAG
ncbi:MAG: mechanosensitive ion channel [Burkholderiales bacterium]|nr:mechanosensitive ion channel [Burkholderiales bacterium]